MRIVELIDERKKSDRKKLTSIEVNSGRTAPKIAEVIDISHAKVERTRTVLDYARVGG
jgi:hypothetical protein